MQAAAIDSRGPDPAWARLVTALDLCQPFLAAADATLRVFAVGEGESDARVGLDEAAVARCNELLDALGAQRGLATPRFVWPAPADATSLELALSNFCGLSAEGWRSIAAAGEVRELAAAPRWHQREVRADGLPPFASFSSGAPGDEAVIIVPPCGVPAKLFQPWLEALSPRCLVATFENPYLFGDWRGLPEPSGEVAMEAAYVSALLDAHGVSRAHLIGICGGAPIAIAAAAELGGRVASLMVCHGDLYFGPETPRTAFQKQFQGYLFEAAKSLDRARSVRRLFLDPNILYSVSVQLAPFILYPYVDAALFHRYAKINHGLMAYDATEAVSRLDQRLLIVTSRNDRMTHPAQSHHLHQAVKGSTLWERDAGNHHDALVPNQELFARILQLPGGGG